MGKTIYLVTVMSMLWTGCAGQNAKLVAQNDKLAASVEEMRISARRERARVRDLEKRLALEQAKASTESNSYASIEERPQLPVEVRSPDGASEEGLVRSAAVLNSEDELPDEYQIMGLDSEGVEIVYVGEAASDKVTKLVQPPSSDDYGDYVERAPRPSLRSAKMPSRSHLADTLEPVPVVATRLPTQSGKVPTIASQLRQARQPAMRSRSRSYGDPRAEYRRYYEALRAGNHSFAVTGFRNFVERFPRHDFADNAQYWLGEAFYDQKRYKSALVEFRKVIDNHPQGNKVPDALLKLGYCYLQNGNAAEAKAVWKQVIAVYPKSNPASLAKQKLSEMATQ